MDKLDQLFIRACKVENSEKRLKSVYRRFYSNKGIALPHIVYNLARIVDENLSYPVVDIISDLSPTYRDDFNSMTHLEKFLDILISKIKYTSVYKFKGLVKPLIMRKAGV